MAEKHRACPYCAEPILVAATKCKHCGEWVERRPVRAAFAYVEAGVGAVSGVVGLLKEFTTDDLGLVDLLVEIGVFGFAMYVALVPAVIVVAGLGKMVPEIERSDRASAAALLVSGTLIAAAIRFGLFADDLTDDLDPFGKFFAALVGAVVISVALWAVGRVKRKN